MIEYNDELVFLVAAANISGRMEHAEKIVVPSDEDLTSCLVYWINEYDAKYATTDCAVNFHEFIERRLGWRYCPEV